MNVSNNNHEYQPQRSSDKEPSQAQATAYSWWNSDYETLKGVQDGLSKGALGALWLSVALVFGWFNSGVVLKPSFSPEGIGHGVTVVMIVGIGPLLAWCIKAGGIAAAWISFIILGIMLLAQVIVYYVIPVLHNTLDIYHWITHYPWGTRFPWEIVQIVVLFIGNLIALGFSLEGMEGVYKLRGKPPPWVQREEL